MDLIPQVSVGDSVPPGLVPEFSLVADDQSGVGRVYAVVLPGWAEWVCVDRKTWWPAQQERWNPAQLGPLVTIVAVGLTGEETGIELQALAERPRR